MKKIEFKTSKGEFVLVDMTHNSYFQNFDIDGYTTKDFIKVSEVTEQQASEIVDKPLWSHCHDCLECNITECKKASPYLDRLYSLLESLGVLWSNPYQDAWDDLCTFGHGGFAKDGKTEFELYTEANERVFNKSTTYLFRKV